MVTAKETVLIVMFLFIVFSIFTLVHSIIVTATLDKFIAVSTDYFKLKCNRSEFEHIYSPYMSAISYIHIGLILFGILNFVLNWRSVKEVEIKSFRRFSGKFSEVTHVLSSS